MWFFKKRVDVPAPEPNYHFAFSQYNQQFPFSEEERMFFNALAEKSSNSNLFFQLERMANGAISVSTHKGFVGKIRLCKKKHWMLVMLNLYDSKIIEGSFDDFVDGIDLWLKYINKYL